MYILQALCAVAIATLCTDVEARWYIHRGAADKEYKFTSRKYTATETLYFKVICDSKPVTINKIEVDGFTGNLRLSAESATRKICSGQTSECIGPEQIQENEFFIYVKPYPDFTNGKVTLKLGQTGTIYEVFHEGSSIRGQNQIALYSGIQLVNYPKKLPQYKITCNGNCRISRIVGIGYNFNIALSKEHIDIRNSGKCKNCYCTTSRNRHIAYCKRGSSESFNLGTSSFYITLDPRGIVNNAKVYFNGANFKSVTKAGYPWSCEDPGTYRKKGHKGGKCTCRHHYGGPRCERCAGGRQRVGRYCCVSYILPSECKANHG